MTMKRCVTCIALILITCAIFAHVSYVSAQEKQSLSVTPPLFQMALTPGQVWTSYIKVVNPNTFPITVYAHPVNFEPKGEDGQGTFLPLVDQEADASSLAAWFTLNKAEIVITWDVITDIFPDVSGGFVPISTAAK